MFRRFDALVGLLLKAMENVKVRLEAHRINGSVSIAVKVLDYLKDSGTGKPFECLDLGMLTSVLCLIKRVAKYVLNGCRHCLQISLAAADPE